jgi:hypothetical protein
MGALSAGGSWSERSPVGSGLVAGLVAVALLVGASLPATAQQEGGTVIARVTVADQLCLLIDEGALDEGLDFGVLDFAGAATSEPYTLESCSTGPQELFGSGTDATSGGETTVSWTLIDGSGTRALDEFSVSAALDSGPAVWLSGGSVASVGTLGAAAIADASHELLTPPVGSAGAGETFTFELTWTATLPD